MSIRIIAVILLTLGFFSSSANYMKEMHKLASKKLGYENFMAEAEKIVEKELKRHGKDGNLWASAASIYYNNDKPQLAIEAINKAIKLQPDHYSYYGARADIYIKLKRFKDACTDINTLFKMDSTIPDPFIYKGRYYFMQDSLEDALHSFERAIEIYESNHMQCGMIEYCYEVYGMLNVGFGNPDKTVDVLTRLLISTPHVTKPLVYLHRALAFYAKGDEDHKVADLDSALTLKPDSTFLSYLYALKGDAVMVDRLKEYELKHNARNWRGAAVQYALLGDKENALKNLEKYLQEGGNEELRWIQMDYNFHKVSSTPEFIALIEKYRKKE